MTCTGEISLGFKQIFWSMDCPSLLQHLTWLTTGQYSFSCRNRLAYLRFLFQFHTLLITLIKLILRQIQNLHQKMYLIFHTLICVIECLCKILMKNNYFTIVQIPFIKACFKWKVCVGKLFSKTAYQKKFTSRSFYLA